MNSGDIVTLTVLVTMTITTGAVLILRPLSRRLGALLEVMTQQKLRAANSDPNDAHRIRELLVSIDSRLNVLEERQDFAEALISAGDTKLLAMTAAQQAQERN